MSVEKLSDESQFRREQAPFAQILNDVIEYIKDNDAFRIYSYLCSKDRNWKVVKEWTAKVCGVGERKAKQCWSYLARCGLIQYIEVRDERGKILKHDINVLVGYDFNRNEPFLNKKQIVVSTGAETAPLEKTHRCKNPPGGQTTRVEMSALLNKDITNKDLKRNKDKSFCASRNSEKPKPDQKQKPVFQKEDNQIRHDWAPMKNEKASIERNETFKRALPPPELRDIVQRLKRRSMVQQ